MFTQLSEVIEAGRGRTVEITVKIVADKAEGDINVTDIMLQGGAIGTKWSGHPSEIQWTVDG